MTTRKRLRAAVPVTADDLALDPETVKDLEPRESAGAVRGGGRGGPTTIVWEGRGGSSGTI